MERLKQLGTEALAFLRALVWPVASSVRDNVGLASLSVVLGFALWIFVTDTENPTRSGTLPFDLPVEAVNVPGDLALSGSPINVRVKVEVADDVWNTLSMADFKATVDLDGLQAGTYDLPVRVEPLTGRGNLRVTQVIPDTLQVELQSLFSKSVSVSVSLEGTPPPGYEATVPKLDADTVLVTGAQDRVTLVSQAVAKLDLTGHTEDLTQAVRLEARDSRGFLVEGVSLEPSVMNVSVKISQTEFSRALVISPTIAGTPADGYNVVSVSADPAVATAFGPQSFVSEAATIRTQPVDITDASDDVVETVALDLPADVSVSGGTSVTVTVKIEPAEGRRTLGITVVAVGLDANLSISGALPLVEVVLLGELPTLQELRPNDVAATINLSGLGAGAHELAVAVSVPAGASVAAVSPAKVSVTLEPR
ncbi:MAG: CdaR family protein [Dehalococcoidia bacterium]|nr:CdaR family protein [Dehalococcoidia bacterium]